LKIWRRPTAPRDDGQEAAASTAPCRAAADAGAPTLGADDQAGAAIGAREGREEAAAARRRHNPEGQAAEEQYGDGAAGEQAQRALPDAVALQRLASVTPHGRRSRQLRRHARALKIHFGGPANAIDRWPLPRPVRRRQLQREPDQGAICRALGQRIWNERTRRAAVLAALPRRKRRNGAARFIAWRCAAALSFRPR
jgi:hypothetical protein